MVQFGAEAPNLLFEREVVWHVVLPFDRPRLDPILPQPHPAGGATWSGPDRLKSLTDPRRGLSRHSGPLAGSAAVLARLRQAWDAIGTECGVIRVLTPPEGRRTEKKAPGPRTRVGTESAKSR
jgi:hypothetical protein